jgi:4-alpha-glucanotransferase
LEDVKQKELAALRDLAAGKGIDLEYTDLQGKIHVLSEDTLRIFFRSMGLDFKTPEDLQQALRQEQEGPWHQLTRPVWVEYQSHLPEEISFQFPLTENLPPDRLTQLLRIELLIEEEGGYQRIQNFDSETVRIKETRCIAEGLFQQAGIPFPRGLPLGVHRFSLSVTLLDKRWWQEITVILCPDRAYLPPVLAEGGKRAGLIAALHGLRSARNWGIGDFSDLRKLVGWAADRLRVEVIGVLPLHALVNREPYNISPYYPTSRLYRNTIYLDVTAIEEYHQSWPAREMACSSDFVKIIIELRNSEKVEYEVAGQLKGMVLEEVFKTFLETRWKPNNGQDPRLKSFKSYINREGKTLELFATFCALDELFRKQPPFRQVWRDWPVPFQDSGSREVEAFCREQGERILFHQYLQWQVEEQLEEVQRAARDKGAEIGLYLDLALGIDPGGADAWAYRDFLVPGVKAGAPPDDFAPLGQDWGFQPANREKHRSQGYRLLADEIRRNCRPGGALRIDHVMKFFRLFWIAEGQGAAQGGYVRDYSEDLIKILCLESLRNKTLIIGEDLGTVPGEVREVLGRHGIFSYRLFYFEKKESGEFKDPGEYPEWALAAVSTHDLPTLAGFWASGDIRLRRDLGLFPDDQAFQAALLHRIHDKRRMIDTFHRCGFLFEAEARRLHAQDQPLVTPELHRAFIGFLVSTPAKLVVLNQEDLFLEINQQNLPGTTDQYPNWKRKMRYSLEDLVRQPEAREMADRYREWIERSGRGIR